MTPVRPATTADLDAVAALEEETFGADAWSRSAVLEEITGPARQVLVSVDDGGTVCGYVVVGGVGEVADLHRVVVCPSRRRSGVAGALLDAVDVTAYARMLLEVRADNEAALAFYRRRGFVEVARRSNYYADGAPTVVMQLSLRAAQ